MKAVILAAGRGSRLGAMTQNTPKPLVQVAGRRCLDYVMTALEPIAEEIIIVTGFLGDQIDAYIASRQNAVPVRTCPNNLLEAGNLTSVAAARAAVGASAFVLTNADHLFPPHFYSEAFRPSSSVTIACERERQIADDEMKVQVDGDKLTAISKTLPQYVGAYIGTTYVPATASAGYWQAFDVAAAQHDLKTACAEHVLGVLAQNQVTAPHIRWLNGINWFEVDNAEDHARAEAGLAV
jgi:L-glutamine-phosphate cytidylyltransferase